VTGYRAPEFGGKASIFDGLAAGAPELVVEIARSSRSYDLGPKLTRYERAGVREYVVVLVQEERVEWRVMEGGAYRLQESGTSGILRSEVFPGLWLDEAAFWNHDQAQLLATLERGLAARQ
jgi:Uma2 family endonuclease